METMETYQSRLTGRDYLIERRIPDSPMISLVSVDKRVRVCTDKGNLRLFYTKLPSIPVMGTSPC